MKRSRVALMICSVLMASTFSSIVGSAPASAVTQSASFNCVLGGSITLNVNAGDILNFNPSCGGAGIQVNDTNAIPSSSGAFTSTITVNVSAVWLLEHIAMHFNFSQQLRLITP